MIIAEIGQNHCGDMDLARKLIVLAKENGADLAKFQLYSTSGLVRTPEILRVLKQGELTFDQAKMLFDYSTEIGIEVFFSVFDVERVEWCEEIGVKRYKIAYSQNRDTELLQSIQSTNKQLIISGNLKQVPLMLYPALMLYCVPEYPTALSALTELRNFPFYGLPDIRQTNGSYRGGFLSKYDGFSDHTIGMDAAKIALARGAQIIEKHFAIDHKTGYDALWSMTPEELAELKRWEKICKEVL